MPVPALLSLAGHDPLGSAGVDADRTAFLQARFYPLCVPTALAVEDLNGVHAVHPVEADYLRDAVIRLARTFDIRGVKIGLLPAGRVDAVAELLAAPPLNRVPVVLDPVLRASGGQDLGGATLAARIVDRLLAHVRAITPNGHELALLAGHGGPVTPEDVGGLARRIRLGRFGRFEAVVCTGLAGPGGGVVDALAHEGRVTTFPSRRRSDPRELHGTGCHFSSALLGALAAGKTLPDAVRDAQAFVFWLAETRRQSTHGPMDLIHGIPTLRVPG